MSNRTRVGVLAIAVAVVVTAFVALKPGDSSTRQDDPADPVATAPSAPFDVEVKGGKPVGGARRIKVQKGDVVHIKVRTDETVDKLHLHGYDIEMDARRRKPADFRFRATIEGVFELESHTAEDAGRDPLFARLVVEP